MKRIITKRDFTCKSNWAGAIITYTPKIELGLTKEDIDAYNIFNNGVVFANASYVIIPGNTERETQGWCWGLFQKADNLPYIYPLSIDSRSNRLAISQEVNNILDRAAYGYGKVKLATLEEAKKLKDLVTNDKVKLGCTPDGSIDCSSKQETLNFLELYISTPTPEMFLDTYSTEIIGANQI